MKVIVLWDVISSRLVCRLVGTALNSKNIVLCLCW